MPRDRKLTGAVMGAGLALALAAGGCGAADSTSSPGSSTPPTTTTVTVTAVPPTPITTASGRKTPPPWPAPDDVSAAVHDARLPMLMSEGTVEHIHAHLDVIVDGKPVPVPAGIGIDRQAEAISPLHTHDDSGIIHVESPVKTPFTLGQFFTEWQVSLSADHIGGLAETGGDTPKTLRVYVNGKRYKGNPAAITLADHQEIAIVYGKVGATTKIPDSYDWPPKM